MSVPDEEGRDGCQLRLVGGPEVVCDLVRLEEKKENKETR